MLRLELFVALVLVPTILFGQDKEDITFTNTNNIDEERYKDVKGSPYYFKNFIKANIITNDLDIFKDMLLNYNGYSGEMEVRTGDSFIELEKSFYFRIEVFPYQNPELKLEFPLIFERRFNKSGDHEYGIIIHDGSKVTFVKEFKVDLLEREINNVGKTIVQKRFLSDETYYFDIGANSTSISLNKRKVLALLEHKDTLEKYIKENKLNVYTEEGVKKLLEYYETL